MATHGFRRTVTGRVTWRCDEVERGLLISLIDQLIEFVEPESMGEDADPLARLVGIDTTAEKPEDPALARLFPDAYPDDVEASADFRRFTERSLREAKVAHAHLVRVALAQVNGTATIAVTDETSGAWLGLLNDLRLALGTRIGITEDYSEELAELSDDDPMAGVMHIYDWLTFLQETLVRSLMR